MLKEFREFALRGNAVDLAIGVIIGAAFGGIVTSLVNDILMPPIGKALGGVDFSNFFLVLGAGHFPSLKAAKDALVVERMKELSAPYSRSVQAISCTCSAAARMSEVARSVVCTME